MRRTVAMQQRWVRAISPQCHEWVSKRNCALSPAQLAVFFGALAMLSLGIAAFWAANGAWVVIPFACIEVAALGAAYVMYGRHAADFDRVVFEPERIRVEATSGSTTQHFECARRAVRIEYGGERRTLVKLVGRGSQIEVGRFVLDADRADLAKELRATLARG